MQIKHVRRLYCKTHTGAGVSQLVQITVQYDVPKRVESHTHTIGLIELLGVPDFYIETVIRKGHAEGTALHAYIDAASATIAAAVLVLRQNFATFRPKSYPQAYC